MLVHFEVKNVETWLPIAEVSQNLFFHNLHCHSGKTIFAGEESKVLLSCLSWNPAVLSPPGLGTCQHFPCKHWYLLLPTCSVFLLSFLPFFHNMPRVRIKILYLSKGRHNPFKTPSTKTVYIEGKCFSVYSESTEIFEQGKIPGLLILCLGLIPQDLLFLTVIILKKSLLFSLQTNISKPTKTLKY